MPGHGALMQRFPLYNPCSSFSFTSFPFSSTKTGCTPGSGKLAHDGIAGVIPAKFEINISPFSVCHQVSTIGHLFFPTLSSYQCQASSLIGSPTVPKVFNDERLFPFNGSKPKPIKLLIAVGAV